MSLSRTRRRAAGFTMVELTVALLAGLIVAMGIVGLSREATNTFHAEARSSAAEASLRAAMDRLRADLQRAGYMSTGNIQTDTLIATKPGQSNVPGSAPNGVKNLQAIHLTSGSTLQQFPLSATNGLAPDMIEIAGNMSTSDQFDVAYIDQTGTGRIYLTPTSPAMYRLLGSGGAAGAQDFQNAFQPDPNKQFIVRLVDDSGRSQFLVLSGTGFQGTMPYIVIDGSQTPLQTAQSTNGVGTLNGLSSGRAWINPVQIVRWEITSATTGGTSAEPTQFVLPGETLAKAPGDPNKFDLMRTVLDAGGSPTIVQEVVAEYVVDLRFAFTVDKSGPVTLGGQPTPQMVAWPFDDGSNQNNQTWGGPALNNPQNRPQRIRSVRVRLATRAAQPDRTNQIDVAPNYNDTYMYRYCISDGGPCVADGTEHWARVRTLTTEVALPNQAKNFF
jgi:hypothetical protein